MSVLPGASCIFRMKMVSCNWKGNVLCSLLLMLHKEPYDGVGVPTSRGTWGHQAHQPSPPQSALQRVLLLPPQPAVSCPGDMTVLRKEDSLGLSSLLCASPPRLSMRSRPGSLPYAEYTAYPCIHFCTVLTSFKLQANPPEQMHTSLPYSPSITNQILSCSHRRWQKELPSFQGR